MKKMTMKALLLSALALFTGLQTFADVDTVYVLSKNNFQIDLSGAPGAGTDFDTAVWYVNGAVATIGSNGYSYGTGAHPALNLKVQGSGTTVFAAQDSTAEQIWVTVEVSKAGEGCSSALDSFLVQVLPDIIVTIAAPTDTFCEQSPTSTTLTARAATISNLLNTITVDSFTWQSDTTDAATGYTSVASTEYTNSSYHSVLTYMSPNSTVADKYKVTANYKLPAGETLILSNGSSYVGTAKETNVTSFPTPVAPTLNGGTVSGW